MLVLNPKSLFRLSFLALTTLLFALRPVLAGEKLKVLEEEIQLLVKSASQSVVTVTAHFSEEVVVETDRGVLSLFGSEKETRALSYVNVGSGVILNEQGHVITRSSVVWGAGHSTVRFADGAEVEAAFVGRDVETGLAVLKIDSSAVVPANFADSDELEVGMLNFVLGNAMGVFPAITFGAVNGMRPDGMIQLSANLHPGTNGSPVINFHGEVIGLVAGQLSTFDAVSGYRHDILTQPTLVYPINWVRHVADDIAQYGYVRKGWLGVVGYHDGARPKISQIKKDSPAEHGGLTKGDVILRFSYQEVNSIAQLAHLVERTPPGQTVALEYLRDGVVTSTQVKLAEKDNGARTAEDNGGPQAPSSAPVYAMPMQDSPDAVFRLLQKNEVLEQRVSQLEKELLRIGKLLETH